MLHYHSFEQFSNFFQGHVSNNGENRNNSQQYYYIVASLYTTDLYIVFLFPCQTGQGDGSTTDSSPISQHSPSIESLPLDETDTKCEEEYLTVTTNGDYTNVEISTLEEPGVTGSTEGLAMVHHTPKRKTTLRKGVSEDHVGMSVDMEDNLVAFEIDISEAIQPTGTNNNPAPSVFREGDIGSITDPDIPLIHCVRTLTSRFLLTGFEHGLIPDRVVRVSVKALALGCVASAVMLHPKTFLLKLHKSSPATGI